MTEIPVPPQVLPYLKAPQEVLLDDGKLLLRIEEDYGTQLGGAAEAIVLRGGKLGSRKSIALPGANVHQPTLTEEDLCNIYDAKKYGVTGVMLPFVRNKGDLQNLKQALIAQICQKAGKPFMEVAYLAKTVRSAEKSKVQSVRLHRTGAPVRLRIPEDRFPPPLLSRDISLARYSSYSLAPQAEDLSCRS